MRHRLPAPSLASRAAITVVAVVTVLAGCGGEGEPDQEGATVTGEPPGTSITADLVTPPGTVLAGGPFPYRSASPSAGRDAAAPNVQALLVVTGDPVEAFADLYDQADDAGIPLLAFHPDDDEEPAFCQVADVEYSEAVGDRYPLDADLPDGELAIECRGTGFADSPAGTRRLDIELVVSERSEPFVSFIRLQDSPASEAGGPSELYVPASPPEGPAPVSPPEPPGTLPGPGEPPADHFAPDDEDYEVLDGSRLAAPPMMSTCTTGGFVAVLTSDHNLNDAVDAYAEQLSSVAFGDAEAGSDDTLERDGLTSRRVAFYAPGGGSASVTGVAGDGVTRLLLERCND